MGFIVEVEFPAEQLAMCKMQGNLDTESLITLSENLTSLHKQGVLYFILEGKKLRSLEYDAFQTFSYNAEKYFKNCTFVFCGVEDDLKNNMGEEVHKFSFFRTEKGCLEFFAQHLGISLASNDEQTDEKCGAATIAMAIPDRIREIVEKELDEDEGEK